MPESLWNIILIILFLAAWWLIMAGLGRLSLAALALPVFTAEGLFLATGIGITLTAYLIFILGTLQALTSHGLHLVTVSASILALGGWLLPLPRRPTPLPGLSVLDHWALGGVMLLLGSAFLLVMTRKSARMP
jgi:hypothetical protein